MKTIPSIKIMCINLLVLMALATGSFAGESQELVTQANKAFISGNEGAAKALYLKAAAAGSADAHYWLAMRFPLTRTEKLSHYSEAAKGGRAEALTAALDMLLFRANSLTETDPQKALDLYNEVKKANPKLNTGYYGEEGARTLKMCAEPKGFNPQQFMKKYGIEKAAGEGYSLWELAEEASKGGRFGKADPELVFNLVIRGGFAPAELIAAVEGTYKNWKKGVAKRFDICQYVTSGYGQGYCAARETDENEEKENDRLAGLSERLGGNSRKLLTRAYDSAAKFFEEKAENEEGYRCGTAHVAMVLSSQTKHMDEYLALVEKVLKKKFKPSPGDSFEITDQRLNKAYRDVMDRLKKDEGSPCPCIPAQKEIKTVQRLWIVYRDASAKLFTSLNPAVNEKTWKNWFTGTRCKELESALQLVQELEGCQSEK
jgi:uncharacterized protein YecT (DUF1311 family)